MIRLDWVSLRRIGYAANFDEQLAKLGAEVPDDPPGGASESDEESDDLDWEYANGDAAAAAGEHEGLLPVSASSDADDVPQQNHTNHINHHNDVNEVGEDVVVDYNDDDDDDNTSSSDDGHGPDNRDVDFASIEPDTPSSVPWCNCNGRTSFMSNAEELGDNGVFVTNAQRKLWEKWVVCKCPDHGSE